MPSEQALQFDPNNAEVYACQGNALYELERYEEAGVAYRRRGNLTPDTIKIL